MTISHRSLDRALLWLGIATWTATIGLTIASLWLRIASHAPPLPNPFGYSDAALVGFGFLQLACATVALLIVARLPRNLVAWLLFGIGLSYAIGGAALAFAAAASARSEEQAEAAWLSQAATLVAGVLTLVLIFVYPQPLKIARSRAVVAVALVTIALLVVVMPSVTPGPLWFWPSIDNPLGVGPRLPLNADDIPSVVPVVGGSAWLVGCVWIVWRYRRSERLERLQLKWFAAAGLVSGAALPLTGALGAIGQGSGPGWWVLLVSALAATLMPIAVGIAILRYHLYAIDRLINRALVYGAVTGLLIVTYALMVVATTSVMAGLTNQGATLAVAISTLTVAALFNPARRRIQMTVDRRFFRARYDATVTVDAFGDRLRRTIDLTELQTEMLGVVGRTLQPVTAGVWLDRKAGRDPYR